MDWTLDPLPHLLILENFEQVPVFFWSCLVKRELQERDGEVCLLLLCGVVFAKYEFACAKKNRRYRGTFTNSF